MAHNIPKDISQKFCPRFGQTAIEHGFITTNQLKEALSIQVDRDVLGKKHLLIGAILFELDLMSSEQIEVILNVMLKAMRTAEVR